MAQIAPIRHTGDHDYASAEMPPCRAIAIVPDVLQGEQARLHALTGFWNYRSMDKPNRPHRAKEGYYSSHVRAPPAARGLAFMVL